MSLSALGGHAGTRGPRLKIRSVRRLQKLREEHGLTALNTWSSGKPATHVQGNSVSQIDFALTRIYQSEGPARECKPVRKFNVAV